MTRLPKSARRRIQIAYAECGNISEVAKDFGVDYKTAKLWISRRYDVDGVEERPGRGRKPGMGRSSARTAYTMLKSQKHDAALVAKKLHVSKSTAIKHARDYAISVGDELVCDKGKPVEQLSEDCMEARVQFSQANIQRDWSNVMFTDRKRFYYRYPGSKVKASVWRSKKVKRQTARRASSPQCLNIYCGITPYGATACHIVSGTTGFKTKFKTKKGSVARNICSAEYYHVVKQTLLPGGNKIFKKHGITSWVMQQDNDRSHTPAAQHALHAFLKKNKKCSIEILQGWPPHSPDLSPIENFWAMVQRKADSMGCNTFTAYKRAVLKLIREEPITWFQHSYASMHDRLVQCISQQGARIQH
jgi:hypothetical protein